MTWISNLLPATLFFYLQVKDEKPPAPTRGAVSKSSGGDQGESTADDVEDDSEASVTNLADLIPRTDIRYRLSHTIPFLNVQYSDRLSWEFFYISNIFIQDHL